ncbi:hypothetical protein EB155_09715 [archaeon]|nr:hypothetical protein [archaeon]NDB80127.1 hypothetical protein [archaeon]
MEIAVSQHTQTAQYLRVYLNSSIVTHDSLQNWREISFNISDNVIQVGLIEYTTNNILISNNDFSKTYDSTSGVTKINTTLTSVEAMALQASANGVNDIYFEFKFDTSIQKTLTLEWDLEVENEAELANFLIWAVMSFALYIPLMIYLDAFNNIRKFVNNPLGNNRRRMRRMRR